MGCGGELSVGWGGGGDGGDGGDELGRGVDGVGWCGGALACGDHIYDYVPKCPTGTHVYTPTSSLTASHQPPSTHRTTVAAGSRDHRTAKSGGASQTTRLYLIAGTVSFAPPCVHRARRERAPHTTHTTVTFASRCTARSRCSCLHTTPACAAARAAHAPRHHQNTRRASRRPSNPSKQSAARHSTPTPLTNNTPTHTPPYPPKHTHSRTHAHPCTHCPPNQVVA